MLLDYLQSVRKIHDSSLATNERSYYTPLENLLNAIGETLQPKVNIIHEAKNEGAGNPDYLLQDNSNHDKRAAVEGKGAGQTLENLVKSGQVGKYLDQYGLVLATNLREFALVEWGAKGERRVIREYSISDNEADFWSASPNKLTKDHEDGVAEFLKFALSYRAELTKPSQLANALASYAKETLRRLEEQPAGSVQSLKEALAKALGLHFTGDEGEHFFRSSLVQTLYYGLFSAWVAWQRQGANGGGFKWQLAGDYLGLPVLRELFDSIARGPKLEELNIRKPFEWAQETLKRTNWEKFNAAFAEVDAINYFYEPFLEAFDPELREQLGVWYTPPEIIRYMVARVDQVLKDELKIKGGLANENVIILDPACGTGGYLVEVLKHIAKADGAKDALAANDLRTAATTRVFGFEILPAPFVVAHLQIGALLGDLGATLGDKQRAGIYLTNSLTGWQLPTEEKPQQLSLPDFPALKREAEAASEVKHDKKILVILGNPPYNSFAGIAIDEERELSNAYRTTQRAPAPRGQGLNDLYVRFFRMAERQIVEESGQGVVCYISNYSWLDGLSHTGMRERYLDAFDRIWIDNLNGDKYRTGKTTPDGDPDPSVFSTPTNREGIQVGTAVTLLARTQKSGGSISIQYRDFWGTSKHSDLTLNTNPFHPITPQVELGYPFRPTEAATDYLSWPKLTELFPVNYPGVKTSRDDVVVDIDEDRLVERIKSYFNPTISDNEIAQQMPSAMRDGNRFDAKQIRTQLIKRGFLTANIVKYAYRPFDSRWVYWEPQTKLLDEKRPEYFPHVFEGNLWITAVANNRREFDPPIPTANLASLHIVERGANLFPRHLAPIQQQTNLFEVVSQKPRLNISDMARSYLDDYMDEEELFFYVLGILHTPAYRLENAGALRQDWPRIPIPNNMPLYSKIATLGHRIAELMDTEKDVQIASELEGIGKIRRVGGGQLDPDDLKITVNWGYYQGSAVMPGSGKTEELSDGSGYRVWLNEVAYWDNIPKAVWEYTLGGYQVIKKWLSYRSYSVLKREITPEEARYVGNMARRIAALIALGSELDANYYEVKRLNAEIAAAKDNS